jgi:hypothetical protein
MSVSPSSSDGDSSAVARFTAEVERPTGDNQRATHAARARAASGRRRHVDPTTCERDYSESELELMHAMQQYKLSSGRMFPTWSEVLEVLTELGYSRPANSTP